MNLGKNITSNYDIDELCMYLNEHPEFKNISIQFDEELKKIKSRIPTERFVFIIGETSYGLCCSDEVAALHLNADIIIRVGTGCFSQNSTLPIYFLYPNLNIPKEAIDELSRQIPEAELNQDTVVFIFSHPSYNKALSLSLSLSQLPVNVNIPYIPYRPDMINTHQQLLYGRHLTSPIQTQDSILYFGNTEDTLFQELCIRFQYTIHSILYFSTFDYTLTNTKDINSKSITSIFCKRFHLIEKAKESNVFGIIIGSLSIKGYNQILDEIKCTLLRQKKKFYTFLLGKITLEKLSNFVEYIDCFVLIACPFSGFYNTKALMKPIVAPLDIKIAFDEKYKWEMKYSFDSDYVLSHENSVGPQSVVEEIHVEETVTEVEELDKKKNQALAKVFSIQVLENYDKRKFKGLDPHEGGVSEVRKFIKGKTGIPIKYENIK